MSEQHSVNDENLPPEITRLLVVHVTTSRQPVTDWQIDVLLSVRTDTQDVRLDVMEARCPALGKTLPWDDFAWEFSEYLDDVREALKADPALQPLYAILDKAEPNFFEAFWSELASFRRRDLTSDDVREIKLPHYSDLQGKPMYLSIDLPDGLGLWDFGFVMIPNGWEGDEQKFRIQGRAEDRETGASVDLEKLICDMLSDEHRKMVAETLYEAVQRMKRINDRSGARA